MNRLETPLLEAIGWTSQMDSTFESNYQTNPTLSYQYFGSATGFLRQYPAGKWPNENGIRTNPGKLTNYYWGCSRPLF